MSGNPRHTIVRDGIEAGALYAMPHHGRVCLHTEDPDLLNVLLEEGLVAPRRPPFLDAAADGVHGAYRPKPQINWFFEPPMVEVLETLRPALEKAGYAVFSSPVPARD